MRGCTFFDHRESHKVFTFTSKKPIRLCQLPRMQPCRGMQGHALKTGSRQWLKQGCSTTPGPARFEQIFSSRAQHGAAPQCRFITSGW